MEGNPGLFHYGIHTVELLYAVLGPGCRDVTCTRADGAEVVTGRWADGRLGTARCFRVWRPAYGCVLFTGGDTRAVEVGTRFVYRELLKQVVEFFRARRPPLENSVTVEIVAFMEAALRSVAAGGGPEPLAL
jgi:hypothetical protein